MGFTHGCKVNTQERVVPQLGLGAKNSLADPIQSDHFLRLELQRGVRGKQVRDGFHGRRGGFLLWGWGSLRGWFSGRLFGRRGRGGSWRGGILFLLCLLALVLTLAFALLRSRLRRCGLLLRDPRSLSRRLRLLAGRFLCLPLLLFLRLPPLLLLRRKLVLVLLQQIRICRPVEVDAVPTAAGDVNKNLGRRQGVPLLVLLLLHNALQLREDVRPSGLHLFLHRLLQHLDYLVPQLPEADIQLIGVICWLAEILNALVMVLCDANEERQFPSL
mmetsp:Transcript_5643/g.10101  ORF Transcript_5643/g.10101 Transcript_5643/m.10101 type:complete len:273 (-) Transcript_5643:3138-3956(-)